MATTLLLISLLACLPNQPAKSPSPGEQDAAHPTFECAQPEGEREPLIREAVENEYWVRRLEFYGIPNTPDRVLRRRLMLVEGDIFTRENLVKSLERLSKLKRLIYPVKVGDVLIKLDRPGRNIDMVICFRERGQRRASITVLRGAPANNGMHPTRFSLASIRELEGLLGCMRAGDAGR